MSSALPISLDFESAVSYDGGEVDAGDTHANSTGDKKNGSQSLRIDKNGTNDDCRRWITFDSTTTDLRLVFWMKRTETFVGTSQTSLFDALTAAAGLLQIVGIESDAVENEIVTWEGSWENSGASWAANDTWEGIRIRFAAISGGDQKIEVYRWNGSGWDTLVDRTVTQATAIGQLSIGTNNGAAGNTGAWYIDDMEITGDGTWGTLNTGAGASTILPQMMQHAA